MGSKLAALSRALLQPARLGLQLGLLGVTLAGFVPDLFPQLPLCVTLESFRPQLLLLGVAFTLLALLFRPRLLALAGPVGVAWNLLVLWPYLPAGPIPALDFWDARATAAPGAPGAGLKVISANVWYRNEDYQATINYLTAADADVVGLLEVTPNWLKALEPLYDRYPYRLDCLDRLPPCEAMLLSKLPFRKSHAGRIDGRSPTIVWGEILYQGRPLTVALTHLTWPLLPAISNRNAEAAGMLTAPPLLGSGPLLQSQQAQNLAQYLAGLDKNLVLMGDFNGVPWGVTQSAFRRATGLDNVGPAVPTWPAWQPEWARLPIDQIFVGGDLARLSFRHGNYINSDHLPVEAEIGFKAAAN